MRKPRHLSPDLAASRDIDGAVASGMSVLEAVPEG